ncbi:MAG TPA: metalloregulator ArsR/SmtB family transcription factor [Usitatibacter sp.]|nr:metalloregulator ArsR/SmtB family transcription factor [Usitatibacter sp.]
MDSPTAVTSLAALAQESRLAIYRLLVEAGPTGLAVGEIGAELEVAPATLSFHLKSLAQSGLVEARQNGRFIYYSASFSRMNDLLAYLSENCCARDCGSGCGPRARNARPSRAAKNRTKETS